MSEELKKLRTEIDAIDEQILKLLSRRAEHAHAIGQLKEGGVVYRPEREAQVLRSVKEKNPGPLSGESVARLFREIMSACLALERKLAVAYLGPPGTFSQAAAIKHFGHAAETVACNSIDEVFRKTESRTVEYAIVPVENSTEGAVGKTLDLMLQTPLKICGEVVLRVHQNLMSKTTDTKAIRKVYSHSQSFAQCHEWLNQHLAHAERIQVASNAEAARIAAEDEASAAIAGEMAAEYYKLNILANNIEDELNNTTRFWVVASHDTPPSGKDKTSIIMTAKNRPGAIYELLAPFAKHNVSMSRLESRPSRTGLWEYVFFIDLEGHQQEKAVAAALKELEGIAAFLKVLGAYPVAVL
jgi:chorismate mutase/prephenate dehydratase